MYTYSAVPQSIAEHLSVKKAALLSDPNNPNSEPILVVIPFAYASGSELRALAFKAGISPKPLAVMLVDAFPEQDTLDDIDTLVDKAKSTNTYYPYEPANTEIEVALAEHLKEILELPVVSIHDDFFELGLDSLRAIHLSIAIESTFAQSIPLAMIFEHNSISKLSNLLTARTG